MAAIMVSRFAFMPATAFLLVKLGAHHRLPSFLSSPHRLSYTFDDDDDEPSSGLRAGLIPAGDPLLIFVLLLQASVPCAQNTVVLLTLQKKPEVKGTDVFDVPNTRSVLPSVPETHEQTSTTHTHTL